MPSSILFMCRTFRSRSVLHGQRTGSSGKHRIWCGIAERKDVQPLRWSVPRWLLAPGSGVLLSGRFSTLPTLLRIFMLMMREIGERVLCGKRWNSVSLCCKRFESSTAADNAPPQKSSDIRLGIFCFVVVQDSNYFSPDTGRKRTKAGYHHEGGILPFESLCGKPAYSSGMPALAQASRVAASQTLACTSPMWALPSSSMHRRLWPMPPPME